MNIRKTSNWHTVGNNLGAANLSQGQATNQANLAPVEMKELFSGSATLGVNTFILSVPAKGDIILNKENYTLKGSLVSIDGTGTIVTVDPSVTFMTGEEITIWGIPA